MNSPTEQALSALREAIRNEVRAELFAAFTGTGPTVRAKQAERVRMNRVIGKSRQSGQRSRRNTDERVRNVKALVAKGLRGRELAKAAGFTPGALYQFTNYHRISLR